MSAAPRTAYFYDRTCFPLPTHHFLLPLAHVAEIGNYNYGPGHPMKPHRIRMTNNLLINYGLYKQLQIYVLIHIPHSI